MELLSCIGFPSAIIIIHEDCGGKMQNSCTIGKVTINKPCTKQKIKKQKAGGLSRLFVFRGRNLYGWSYYLQVLSFCDCYITSKMWRENAD